MSDYTTDSVVSYKHLEAGTINFLFSVPRPVNESEGYAILKSFAYKYFFLWFSCKFLSYPINNK